MEVMMWSVIWVLSILIIFFWCITPIITNLPIEWKTFNEMYPNKWKQLIVIFISGPIYWFVFFGLWLYNHGLWNLPQRFNTWLKR